MREIDPSISKALDEVVLRALRKDPAQRYQTAADMALDLRKALGKPSGGFVKTPKGGKRKKGPMDTVRNEYKAVDARLRRARMRAQSALCCGRRGHRRGAVSDDYGGVAHCACRACPTCWASLWKRPTPPFPAAFTC